MLPKFIHILAVVFLTFTSKANEQALTLRPQKSACIIPCEGSQALTNQDGEKITVLTFYIQQKVEQAEDFIQMSLTLKEKDTSLKKAVDLATRKVQLIRKSCYDYCVKNRAQNCQGRVQVDNFQVQAAYQSVRRQPIFNGFVVTHKIKIIVLETKHVGQLVDILLNLGIYQIDQLQWKPNVQVDVMEKAIDAGISKGRELCQHINRRMGAILSINQIYDENQDDQNKGEQDEGKSDDQDQDQQEPSVLKFQVQCVGNIAEQQQINKKANQKPEKKKKKKQKK